MSKNHQLSQYCIITKMVNEVSRYRKYTVWYIEKNKSNNKMLLLLFELNYNK